MEDFNQLPAASSELFSSLLSPISLDENVIKDDEFNSLADLNELMYTPDYIEDFNTSVDYVNNLLPDNNSMPGNLSEEDAFLSSNRIEEDPYNKFRDNEIAFDLVNSDYDRVAIHPAFKRLGFDPRRNNNAFYNENTTLWGDMRRVFRVLNPLISNDIETLGQWQLPGNANPFVSGFTGGYRSIGEFAKGESLLAPDYVGNKALARAMELGSIDRDGNALMDATKFMANLGISFSHMGGIIANAYAETTALTAIGSAVGSAGTPVGTAVGGTAGLLLGIGKGIYNVGRFLGNAGKVAKTVNNSRKMLNALSRVNTARDFYNGVRLGEAASLTARGVANRFAPSTYSALKTIKTLEASGEFAKANAMKSALLFNFAIDTKAAFTALNEGQMLYVDSQNKVIGETLNEILNGRNISDLSDEEVRIIGERAQYAGQATTLTNAVLSYVANSITLRGIFKGRNKFVADVFEQNKPEALRRIVRGKSVSKGGELQKDLFVDLGDQSLVDRLLPIRDIKAMGFKEWASSSSMGMLRYAAANLAEGVEEVYQEATIAGISNYYTKLTTDPNMQKLDVIMASLSESGKNVFSAEGFNNFLGGFLMGGYSNVFSAIYQSADREFFKRANPEEYKKYIERRKNILNRINIIGNRLIDDPATPMSPMLEKLGNVLTAELDKEEALLRNDALGFGDSKLDQRVGDMLFMARHGASDLYIQQLRDLQNLTDEELEQYSKLDPTAGTPEQMRERIDKRIKQIESFTEDYNKTLGIVINPYNPNKFKPGSAEYNIESLKHEAYEMGRTLLILSKETFKDAVDRMESIQNNFREAVDVMFASPNGNMEGRPLLDNDLIMLTNEDATDTEITTLSIEIGNIDIKTLKEEIETLSKNKNRTEEQESELLSKKTVLKNYNTKKTRLEAIIKFKEKLKEFNLLEGLKPREYNKAKEKLFEDFIEFVYYFNLDSDLQYDETILQELLQGLIDHAILDLRSKIYSNVVTMFNNPKAFGSIFDKYYEVVSRLNKEKAENFRKNIEAAELTERQQKLINSFLDFGYVPDAAETIEFVKTNDPDKLKTFWKNGRNIKENDFEWPIIQAMINNYKDLDKKIKEEDAKTKGVDKDTIELDEDTLNEDDVATELDELNEVIKELSANLIPNNPKVDANLSYISNVLLKMHEFYRSSLMQSQQVLDFNSWINNLKLGGRPAIALYKAYEHYQDVTPSVTTNTYLEFKDWLIKKYTEYSLQEEEGNITKDFLKLGIDINHLNLISIADTIVNFDKAWDIAIVKTKTIESDGSVADRYEIKTLSGAPVSQKILNLGFVNNTLIYNDLKTAEAIYNGIINYLSKQGLTIVDNLTLKDGTQLKPYDRVIENDTNKEHVFLRIEVEDRPGEGRVESVIYKSTEENSVEQSMDQTVFINKFSGIKNPSPIVPNADKLSKIGTNFINRLSNVFDVINGKRSYDNAYAKSLVFSKYIDLAKHKDLLEIVIIKSQGSNQLRNFKTRQGEENPFIKRGYDSYTIALRIKDDTQEGRDLQEQVRNALIKQGLPTETFDGDKVPYRGNDVNKQSGIVAYIPNGSWGFADQFNKIHKNLNDIDDSFIENNILLANQSSDVDSLRKAAEINSYIKDRLDNLNLGNGMVAYSLDSFSKNFGITINLEEGSYEKNTVNNIVQTQPVNNLHKTTYTFDNQEYTVVLIHQKDADDNYTKEYRISDANGLVPVTDPRHANIQKDIESNISNKSLAPMIGSYILIVKEGNDVTSAVQIRPRILTSSELNAINTRVNNGTLKDLSPELFVSVDPSRFYAEIVVVGKDYKVSITDTTTNKKVTFNSPVSAGLSDIFTSTANKSIIESNLPQLDVNKINLRKSFPETEVPEVILSESTTDNNVYIRSSAFKVDVDSTYLELNRTGNTPPQEPEPEPEPEAEPEEEQEAEPEVEPEEGPKKKPAESKDIFKPEDIKSVRELDKAIKSALSKLSKDKLSSNFVYYLDKPLMDKYLELVKGITRDELSEKDEAEKRRILLDIQKDFMRRLGKAKGLSTEEIAEAIKNNVHYEDPEAEDSPTFKFDFKLEDSDKAEAIDNLEGFFNWININLPDFITAEQRDVIKKKIVGNPRVAGMFVSSLETLSGGVQIKGRIITTPSNRAAFHEAFHAVFDLLLTDKERRGYIRSTKQDLVKRYGKDGYAKRLNAFIEKFPGYATKGNIEDTFLEEEMADRFAEFKVNPKDTKTTTKNKSLFNRIIALIKSILQKFSSHDINILFRDIDAGKYKNAQVKTNQYTESVGSGVVQDSYKLLYYHQYKDGIFTYKVALDPALSEQLIMSAADLYYRLPTSEEGVPKTKEENIDLVRQIILDTYEPKDDDSDENYELKRKIISAVSINNGKDFRDAIIEYVDLFNSQMGRVEESQEEEEEQFGIKRVGQYDKSSDETGGFENLGTEIKMFIANTFLDSKDMFGNKEFSNGMPLRIPVDFQRAYNGLMLSAQNEFDQVEMLISMYIHSRGFEHTKIVFDKFLDRVGIDINEVMTQREIPKHMVDAEFFNKFMNAFYNVRVEYYIDHEFRSKMGSDTPIRLNVSEQEGIDGQMTYWSNVQSNKIIESKSNPVINSDRVKMLDQASAIYESVLSKLKVSLPNTPLNEKLQEKDIVHRSIMDEAGKISRLVFEATGILINQNYILASIIVDNNRAASIEDPDSDALSPYFRSHFTNKIAQSVIADFQPFNASYIGILKKNIFKYDSQNNVVMSNMFDKTTGSQSLAKELAYQNLFYDDTLGFTTYTTPTNKQIYPNQRPTFHHVRIKELNNEAELDRLKSSDSYYEDNFLLNNPAFIKIVNNKALKTKRVIAKSQSTIFSSDYEENIEGDLIGYNSLKDNIISSRGLEFGDYSTYDFITHLYKGYTANVNPRKSKQPITKIVKYKDERGVEQSVALAPVSIRIMESSSRLDEVDLPIIKAVDANPNYKKGGKEVAFTLSDVTINAFLNEIKREYNSIRENYAKTEDEVRAEPILGYNINQAGERKGRAYHFFKMEPLMDQEYREFLENKAKDNLTFEEAVAELESAMIEDISFNEYIERNLIDDFKNHLENHIEPRLKDDKVYYEDINLFLQTPMPLGENVMKMLNLTNDNIYANLAQVYFNDWVNTLSINQLISGNEARLYKEAYVDPIKRGKARNASTINAEFNVVDPNLGITHTLGDGSIAAIIISDEEFDHYFSRGTGERGDAQVYLTAKGSRYISFGIGSLNKAGANLMDKVDNGDVVTTADFLTNYKAAAINSKKLVYADEKTYIKMSAATLTKQDDSYVDENGNRVPYPGIESKYRVRMRAESLEKRFGNRIVMIAPTSAVKTYKHKVIPYERLIAAADNFDDIGTDEVTFLNAKNLGLQMVNPSNKVDMLVPTQMKLQITTEQNKAFELNLEGNKVSIRNLIEDYHRIIGSNIMLDYGSRLGLMFDSIQNLDIKLAETVLKEMNVDANLYDFLEYARRNIKSAKGSSKSLDLFSHTNGIPNYSLNTPYTMKDFSSFMMNYIAKKSFNERAVGLSLTLKSDSYERVYREVYSLDADGNIDKQRVIRKTDHVSLKKPRPAEYDEKSRLVTYPDGTTEFIEDALAKGPVYIVDRLRVNLPEYENIDEDPSLWVKTNRTYAEAIVPPHFKEIDTWLKNNIGKTLPKAFANLFAVRIPSQDKHSAIGAKIVDFSPPYYGSTVVFPFELIEIAGSDFDIDKVYAQILDWYYSKGKIRVFGDAKTEEEGYRDYIRYQLRQLNESGSTLNSALKAYKQTRSFYDNRIDPDKKLTLSKKVTLNGEDKDVRIVDFKVKRAKDLQIVLQLLGLPVTLDEYKTFKTKNGIEPYKAANDNKIQDIRISLESNEAMTKSVREGYAPIAFQPADTAALERELDFMKKMFPRVSELTSTTGFSIDNINGKVKSHQAVKENSKLIGIPVSLNNALAILKEFGIKLNPNFSPLEIEGVIYDGFDRSEMGIKNMNVSGKDYEHVDTVNPNDKDNLVINLNAIFKDDRLNPEEALAYGNETFAERYKDLFEGKITSEEDIDFAKAQYQSAWVDYLSSKSNSDLLETLQNYGSVGVFTDSYDKKYMLSETIAAALNQIKYENANTSSKEIALERTQYVKSNVITAATDDAKLRLLSGLGLQRYQMKLASVMVAMAVPLKDIITFINTDVVKQVAASDSNSYKAIRDLSREIIKELSQVGILEKDLENLPSISLNEMVYNVLYTDSKDIPANHAYNNAIIRYKVIKELNKIDAITTFASKMVTVTSLNNGFNDFLKLNSIRQDIKDLRLDVDPNTGIDYLKYYKGKPIPFDVREVFNYSGDTNPQHYLGYYLKIFKHFDEVVLPSLMTIKTDLFNLSMGNLSKFMDMSPKQEYAVSLDILSYLIMRTYINYANITPEFAHLRRSLSNDIFYISETSNKTYNETVANSIDRLNDYYISNNQSNYFLERFAKVVELLNEDKDKGIVKIQSNTFARLSPNEKIRIQNDFALMFNNPATKDDAIHLLHYMFVKDGFQFAKGSLFAGIPLEIFKNVFGISDALFKAFKTSNGKLKDGVLKTENDEPWKPAAVSNLLGRDFYITMAEFNYNYPLSSGKSGYIKYANVPTEPGFKKDTVYYQEYLNEKEGSLIYREHPDSSKDSDRKKTFEFPLYIKLNQNDVYRLISVDDNLIFDFENNFALITGSQAGVKAIYGKIKNENTNIGHYSQNPIGFVFSNTQSLNTFLQDTRPTDSELFLLRKQRNDFEETYDISQYYATDTLDFDFGEIENATIESHNKFNSSLSNMDASKNKDFSELDEFKNNDLSIINKYKGFLQNNIYTINSSSTVTDIDIYRALERIIIEDDNFIADAGKYKVTYRGVDRDLGDLNDMMSLASEFNAIKENYNNDINSFVANLGCTLKLK